MIELLFVPSFLGDKRRLNLRLSVLRLRPQEAVVASRSAEHQPLISLTSRGDVKGVEEEEDETPSAHGTDIITLESAKEALGAMKRLKDFSGKGSIE